MSNTTEEEMSKIVIVKVLKGIDLTKFCSENGRFAMDEPWVEDGWAYATDGHHLIRVRADGMPDSPPPDRSHGSRPPLGKLFDPAAFSATKQSWPTDGMVRKMWPCNKCVDGSTECPTCHEHTIPCQKCDGEGKFVQDVARKVGEHYIGAEHDALIRELPNVQYVTGVPISESLPFVFDGGEGRVVGRNDRAEIEAK